jgi:hypothetical protein
MGMGKSSYRDGFPGDMANWMFSAFKSTKAQDESSIYLGFKRIEESKPLTHGCFLDLINPGNAAIILKLNFGEPNKPETAGIGHFTCAWIEDEKAEGYFYYDSLIGVSYSTRNDRRQYQHDWQKVENNGHRVLYIFNLPLDPNQRSVAINGAVRNLMDRFNGITANALLLSDFHPNLFSYLSS